MPQFDLDTYTSQCFWFLLCFCITAIYTIFFAFPRLNNLFDERWKKSGKSRIKATRVLQQVEDLENKIEHIITDSNRKRDNFLRTIIIDCEKNVSQCSQNLREIHKQQILITEQDMYKHKEKILRDLMINSDQLSKLIEEKVMNILHNKKNSK